MTEYRIERDSMGEVKVPVEAKWRAQTQRAVENFPISGQGLEAAHIAALGPDQGGGREGQRRARRDRRGHGRGDPRGRAGGRRGQVGRPVPDRRVPDRVGHVEQHERERGHRDAGHGAARAEPVHPNDHVNASPVANDVFPSSIHIAATSALINELIPALEHLAAALAAKAAEFATVVKSGRTHLMDATPVTLGQEFGGYAAQVRLRHRAARGVAAAGGGAAAGRYGRRHRHQHAAGLRREGDRGASRGLTGLPLTEARNHFEAQGARDALVELSGAAAHDRGQPLQDLPTTCAGWVRVRGPGSARSSCPTCSRARRSCRARSTRCCREAMLQVCAAGDRQRRRGGVRRRDRQLRAERDAAGDGPQRAGVDPAAGQHLPGCSPTGASPGSGQRGAAAASTPSRRRRSSPRSTATSATRRPPRSPSRRSRSGKTIREVVIERGLRRAAAS